jgi:hypothetical protein
MVCKKISCKKVGEKFIQCSIRIGLHEKSDKDPHKNIPIPQYCYNQPALEKLDFFFNL